MPRYAVLLYPEEGGYTVLVPSLPGCVSQGDTVDEALSVVREAIELHLAGMAEDGEDIPSDDQPPVVATVEATMRAPVPA